MGIDWSNRGYGMERDEPDDEPGEAVAPCRYCGSPALVLYGGDTGKANEETSIHCEGRCKMKPLISAMFYNDAVKMWNAAMACDKGQKT